jgi:hypothetical protein
MTVTIDAVPALAQIVRNGSSVRKVYAGADRRRLTIDRFPRMASR